MTLSAFHTNKFHHPSYSQDIASFFPLAACLGWTRWFRCLFQSRQFYDCKSTWKSLWKVEPLIFTGHPVVEWAQGILEANLPSLVEVVKFLSVDSGMAGAPTHPWIESRGSWTTQQAAWELISRTLVTEPSGRCVTSLFQPHWSPPSGPSWFSTAEEDKSRHGRNTLHSLWECLALPGMGMVCGAVCLGLEKQQMAKLPKQRLNHLGGLIRASELVLELKQLLPGAGLSQALCQYAENVGLEQKPGARCRQQGCCGCTELNSSF